MMLSAVASAAHPHRAAAKLGSRAPTRALRNAAVAPRRKVARQLIEATISKDNVFANNPGSLAALSAMGVNNQVPVTPNMMPFEDLASATMPHRERLKVFSGSAHPELSNVSPFSPSRKGAVSPGSTPRICVPAEGWRHPAPFAALENVFRCDAKPLAIASRHPWTGGDGGARAPSRGFQKFGSQTVALFRLSAN